MAAEVIAAGLRMDASAFGIERRQAIDALTASGLPLAPLFGEDGLCTGVAKVVRFRRIYVDAEHGVPFLSSSDIISMRPEITNYLSKKLMRRLDEQLVLKWDVLISRSGTVGNVGLAGLTHAGKALSEDAIRLRADSSDIAGYVSAFGNARTSVESSDSRVTHSTTPFSV